MINYFLKYGNYFGHMEKDKFIMEHFSSQGPHLMLWKDFVLLCIPGFKVNPYAPVIKLTNLS